MQRKLFTFGTTGRPIYCWKVGISLELGARRGKLSLLGACVHMARKLTNIDVTSSVHMANDLAHSSTMSSSYPLSLHGDRRFGGSMEASPSRNLGHLSYTSDKHPKHFLESMCLLYKRHELCDVTLCVGSHRIPAHKVVLSACSPYFCAMFTGESSLSIKQRRIEIKWNTGQME